MGITLDNRRPPAVVVPDIYRCPICSAPWAACNFLHNRNNLVVTIGAKE